MELEKPNFAALGLIRKSNPPPSKSYVPLGCGLSYLGISTKNMPCKMLPSRYLNQKTPLVQCAKRGIESALLFLFLKVADNVHVLMWHTNDVNNVITN